MICLTSVSQTSRVFQEVEKTIKIPAKKKSFNVALIYLNSTQHPPFLSNVHIVLLFYLDFFKLCFHSSLNIRVLAPVVSVPHHLRVAACSFERDKIKQVSCFQGTLQHFTLQITLKLHNYWREGGGAAPVF